MPSECSTRSACSPPVVRASSCRCRICRPTVPCCDSSERSSMPEMQPAGDVAGAAEEQRAGTGIEGSHRHRRAARAAQRVMGARQHASRGSSAGAPRRSRARRPLPRRRPGPWPRPSATMTDALSPSARNDPRVAADRLAGRRQADRTGDAAAGCAAERRSALLGRSTRPTDHGALPTTRVESNSLAQALHRAEAGARRAAVE